MRLCVVTAKAFEGNKEKQVTIQRKHDIFLINPFISPPKKYKAVETMNDYLKAQITNMTTMVKTFELSCKMAALKNDGKVDKTEEKQLKKISAASKKFIQELEKIC